MINFSDTILQALEGQGRSKKWLSEQVYSQAEVKIEYKAFLDRLKRNSLTAEQLVIICKELGIDMNVFKIK